ncbi:hypothetical protein CRG98_046552 [Punica granatum]|uniref:Bulb-type lectin domain-containing protein n=1 Tax=Punica granatum TaxID=22663 RepID=A0A2I0HMS7_PUNGR|nr:hypothetical protein CRG98_046552 [Punica granatum]
MDQLNPSQPMTEGDTLISAGGKFQLGFFSMDNPRIQLGFFGMNNTRNRHLEHQMTFLVCSTVFWSLLTSLPILAFCASMDQPNPSQPMNEGDTLISAGGKFQLGFFSTDNSRIQLGFFSMDNTRDRYLGIWFYNIPSRTIVWVANRDKPLDGSPGLLKIEHGNLVIQDNSGKVIWLSNILNLSSSSINTKLMDFGNLVLIYDNSESYLWQSFDHPSDTMLAGMKIGWDFKFRMEQQLTSWKSALDPFSRQFSYRMDSHGLPAC